MFRDARQLARAMRLLLGTAGLAGLWTETGPSELAGDLAESDGGPLSRPERVLFLAAWTLAHDKAAPALSELAGALEIGALETLCTLIVALKRGPDAVDEWLDTPTLQRFNLPPRHCGRAPCDGQTGVSGHHPRLYSGRPFCRCACDDCVRMRGAEDRAQRDLAIWWTTDADSGAIELADGWPDYLRRQFRRRRDQKGHGVLYVDPELIAIPDVISPKAMRRWASHAGLVVRRADVHVVKGLGGVVTDIALRPIDGESAAPDAP